MSNNTNTNNKTVSIDTLSVQDLQSLLQSLSLQLVDIEINKAGLLSAVQQVIDQIQSKASTQQDRYQDIKLPNLSKPTLLYPTTNPTT